MESGNLVILGFNYDTDIPQGTPVYVLNTHATEWQMFQMTFVAEEDFHNVNLLIMSQNNANNLYVTHFTLTKDFGMNTYNYDEKGNLINATDLVKESTTFQYDDNNQLVSSFTPKGSNFKFEYDTKNSSILLQGTSSMGLANIMEYDNYKNPIKTIIKNVGKKPFDFKTFYIREKGTKKYLNVNYFHKTVTVNEISCNINSWQLEKEGEFYYLKTSLKSLYVTIEDQKVILTEDKGTSTLIRLQENKNGSYSFIKKDSNQTITVNNKTLIIEELNYENTDQQFFLEIMDSSFTIESKAEYTSDGKFVKKTIDSLGKETMFDINPLNGLTNKIINPKGQEIKYNYNEKDQIDTITKDNKAVNYHYNQNNRLSEIISGTKEYTFDYDNYLNTKQIKINNKVLATNHYEEKNGALSSINYGNHTSLSYTYDELDRLKTYTKGDKTYHYFYNHLNQLCKITSLNETLKYDYDFAERLVKYENNNNSIQYTYDINSNILSKQFKKNSQRENINYIYDSDDNIIQVNFNNQVLNYNYDELGRLASKNINQQLPIEYSYYGNGKKTSFVIKSMKINHDKYRYFYDDVYNITHIYKNNNLINQYYYDNFNQLIKEDNYTLNKTYQYSYDLEGNILSKKEYEINTSFLLREDKYEYNNPDWEDQLTKYNHENISYDEIGNLIKIGDTILSWNNGRELQTIENNKLNIGYQYNKDGIRIKKIVNNIETNYFTENHHLIFEETDGNVLYFMRDDNNQLLGIKHNNEIYYYQKNIQEDIVGIYNKNYELIATYEYDSWGKVVSIKDNNNQEITDQTHIAIQNPFRYRSYYYDKETKLYYLNSRYYNPEWGRFLNADGLIGTTSSNAVYNLYCYVNNNPINSKDELGNLATTLVVGGLFFLAGLMYIAGDKLAKSVAPVIDTTIRNIERAVVDTIDNIKTQAQSSSKQDKSWTVYTLFNEKEKRVDYVGRTSNEAAREIAHRKNPERAHLIFSARDEDKNLTYEVARGREQFLITYYKTLNSGYQGCNKINGISPNNPKYKFYMEEMYQYYGETYVGGIGW